MKKLYIFNPEHDLCLANGTGSYVAPASALLFGQKGAEVYLREVYGDEGIFCSSNSLSSTPIDWFAVEEIVPWGWNKVLTTLLRHAGAPERLLPSDDLLSNLRTLQHRGSLCRSEAWRDVRGETMHFAASLAETEALLTAYNEVVLKSPLSGSGRGLRWVSGELSEQDRRWIDKILRQQGGVVVEKRRKVVADFALEYHFCKDLTWVGYSLFCTQNGVYRGNYLLSDAEIRDRLSEWVTLAELDAMQHRIESALKMSVPNAYKGPIGVDLFVCEDSKDHALQLAEVNYRHTMGLVAHSYELNHPAEHGTLWRVTT